MAHHVVHASELEWEERETADGAEPRRQAVVTDPAALTESRARMWRYPAHTRGRRHADPEQEEVFVPLRGTLTLLVEEPPQRVDVEPGGVVAVHAGTPLQARNETDEEILFFVYGAPPVSGNAEFLDDVPDAPPA
jgi:quercetin dioxygenase-like cupin family protein